MESNYQLLRIHNYVNGLMSSEDMYLLEREALNDPFLQDAIDGYMLQKGVDSRSLSLLQQRLEKRVIARASLKNKQYFSWQRLTLGALAAVMFITVCTLFLIRYIPSGQYTKVTDVELMEGLNASFRVKAKEGSDVKPRGGWEKLETYMSNQTFTSGGEKTFNIYFKVDKNGNLYDVASDKSSSTDSMFKELSDMLKSGPKWEGSQGAIEIVISH